jgi:hypothetical protein
MSVLHRNLWRFGIIIAGLLLDGGVAANPAGVGAAAPAQSTRAVPFAAPAASCTTVSFGPGTGYGVGTNPHAVAVGDFNRDGHLDLAVANQTSLYVTVRWGEGCGGFNTGTNFAVNSNQPWAVATGDFNRDGNLDLATANYGLGNISVLLGDGVGGFSTSTWTTGGTSPDA